MKGMALCQRCFKRSRGVSSDTSYLILCGTRMPAASTATQQPGAGYVLPPPSSAPAPVTSAPAPASQWGAYAGEPATSAPTPQPDWGAHSSQPLSQLPEPKVNGWASTSDPAMALPGLGPDITGEPHSAGASNRKRSRWSDTPAAQPPPAAHSQTGFSAPEARTLQPHVPAHSSERGQNGHAGMPWEGRAAETPHGALPPPPPMRQQQQDGGLAAGPPNGSSAPSQFHQAPPPAASAAGEQPDGGSGARPARRSRWETAAAAPSGGEAAAASSRQPAQQGRQPPSEPSAAQHSALALTPQAVPQAMPQAAPRAGPIPSQPVWTGEGVAPWVVAQEAAAEARRAAQGDAGPAKGQQQGQLQQTGTDMLPGVRQAAAAQAPMPGLAVLLPEQLHSQPQAASSMPVPRPGAPPSQQQAHRPSALGVPRPGPPPPSHGGPMPGHPMAGPQHHQQMQMQQQQHHQQMQQQQHHHQMMQQQQQHHFQQMQMQQQQQQYGVPPPMAFYGGPGGAHPQPGLMRPGFPPRPGPFQGMPGPRPPPGQPSAAGRSSCSSGELCHDHPWILSFAACDTATCTSVPMYSPLRTRYEIRKLWQ